mgnify:CR=1 FL=1
MKPFRFFKNIRTPSHKIFTHCFIFFVNILWLGLWEYEQLLEMGIAKL